MGIGYVCIYDRETSWVDDWLFVHWVEKQSLLGSKLTTRIANAKQPFGHILYRHPCLRPILFHPTTMKSDSLIAIRQAAFEKTIAENAKRGSVSNEFITNHNTALSNSLRSTAGARRREGPERQTSIRKNFQSINEIEDEFERIMSMGDSSASLTTSSSGW